MNLPNRLTILRIFLVVPFIILLSLCIHFDEKISYSNSNKSLYFFITAGIIFIVAMITDAIDGYVARKYNLISTFGKLFDPLADKIMTTSAFLMLSIMGMVPFWITLVFIVRDIVVDGSRNVAASNKINIAASWWGKWKTMLQSFGVTLIFIIFPSYNFSNNSHLWYGSDWKLALLEIPILVSLILSIGSGWLYFKQIIPYISIK